MGIKMYRVLLIILPLLVAGLRYAEGNPEPNPLVSSSGMISMKLKKEASPNTTEVDSGPKPPSLLRSFPDGRVSVVTKQDVPVTDKKEPPYVLIETVPPIIAKQEKENKRKADVIEAAILSESLKDNDNRNHSSGGIKFKNDFSGGKRQRKADPNVDDDDDDTRFVVEDKEKIIDLFDGKPNNNGGGDKVAMNPAFHSLNIGFDEDSNYTSGGGGGGGDQVAMNSGFHSLNVGFDEDSNYTSGGGDDTGADGKPGGSDGGGDGGDDNDPSSFDDTLDIGGNHTHDAGNLQDDPIPLKRYPIFKMGAPWKDPIVVGDLVEAMNTEPVEVSFKVAEKLCNMMRQTYKGTNKPLHYYLWAPIHQYVPLTHNAFPIRPPVFSPECLKCFLRPCRGETRRPLLKPCTYWAPMRIRRPECGFVPQQKFKLVNYRETSFIPGNCPCIWPCTRRFDRIQRCRVPVEKEDQKMDRIDIEGDPGIDAEINIQENYAFQLCRSMKLATSSNTLIPIGWLPIRIENLKPNHQVISGKDYYGISKRETGGETQKVIPKLKKQTLKTKQKWNRHGHRHHKNLKKRVVVISDHLQSPNISQRQKRSLLDNGLDETEDNGDGDQGVLFISFDPETHDDSPDGLENVDRATGGGDGGGGNKYAGYVGERCPVWHYKACPKPMPAEDVVSAEGDHEKPDTSIETEGEDEGDVDGELDRIADDELEGGANAEVQGAEEADASTARRKRRTRVRRQANDSDPSGALNFSFDEAKTYKEGEGSFEKDDSIEKGSSGEGGRSIEEKSSEESGSTNKTSSEVEETEEICNEWYVTEGDCVPEVPASTKPTMTGRTNFEGKEVVKGICPGGGDFPCFLKRKKHASNKHKLLNGQVHRFRLFSNRSKIGPIRKHEMERLQSHKRMIRRTDDVSDSNEGISWGDKRSISEEGSFSSSDSSSSSFEEDFEVESYESNLMRRKKSDGDSNKIFLNKIRLRLDSSCRCDWPCLPFYDSINKCYDDYGNLLVNSSGKPVVLRRSYRKNQRDPVVCVNFADTDEIYCKIKNIRSNSGVV